MPSKVVTGNIFMHSAIAPVPRMVSDSDVALVSEFASGLKADDVVLEFGPWLGGLSLNLARKCTLHVVDSFVWTKHHARRVEGLHDPGEDFQSSLEKILETRQLKCVIHKSTFSKFRWAGGKISAVVIDAPKTGSGFIDCIQSVVANLNSDGHILLKNGLASNCADMTACVERLIQNGTLRVPDAKIVSDSNILILQPGPSAASFEPALATRSGRTKPKSLAQRLSLPPGHAFQASELVDLASKGDFSTAYEVLAKLPSSRILAREWDAAEPGLRRSTPDLNALAELSDIVVAHSGDTGAGLPYPVHKSRALSLRSYWLCAKDCPQPARGFFPEIIGPAYEMGYMNWPSKIRNLVFGKSVLDFGCGSGLHGIGCLAVGAKSYFGIDSDTNIHSDVVKNFRERSTVEFGMSPVTIAKKIDRFEMRQGSIGDIDSYQKFGLVTLHSVTEHLFQLEETLLGLTKYLAEGGRIAVYHNNYYAWNGHQRSPKTVEEIDESDESQSKLLDWRHIDFEPPKTHYISRKLNRLRIDEVKEIFAKHFTIEEWSLQPITDATGLNRLTREIEARFPSIKRSDFLTASVFCVLGPKS